VYNIYGTEVAAMKSPCEYFSENGPLKNGGRWYHNGLS